MSRPEGTERPGGRQRNEYDRFNPDVGSSPPSAETDRSEHWIQVSDVAEFGGEARAELESTVEEPFRTYNLLALFHDHANLIGIDGQTYWVRLTDVRESEHSDDTYWVGRRRPPGIGPGRDVEPGPDTGVTSRSRPSDGASANSLTGTES